MLPKLFIPASVSTAAGFGLDMMGNTLAQVWPDAPYEVWMALFVSGAVLAMGLPVWAIWTFGAFALGRLRKRASLTPEGAPLPTNLQDWQKVDPLYVWQAGCLWKGVGPQYPVMFANPAYGKFSMLLRAVEHGQIKPVTRVKKSELAFAQISRSELKRYAASVGEAPTFLFESESELSLRAPPTKRQYFGLVAGLGSVPR